MKNSFRSDLRRALSGNLVVQDTEGVRFRDAVVHIAAAQLKAIAIAINAGKEPTMHDDSWCIDEGFTAADAVAAIGGVSSLLSQLTSIAMQVESEEATERHAEAAE